MKMVLVAIGFMGLSAFGAQAEAAATCTTYSRGIWFEATARNERQAANRVVRACERHRSTRIRDCERNLECRRERDRDDRLSRDGRCYLNRYPDICQNSPNNYCKDPEKHYREHGRREGRIWGCR